ncbi:hypothetical protein [Sorangium sp. So ce887]|uniref:hypothetical protein n=1 Tax=Sorangium sp. So ce887 TaxID=3133324 RepID=UPI003F5F05FD
MDVNPFMDSWHRDVEGAKSNTREGHETQRPSSKEGRAADDGLGRIAQALV